MEFGDRSSIDPAQADDVTPPASVVATSVPGTAAEGGPTMPTDEMFDMDDPAEQERRDGRSVAPNQCAPLDTPVSTVVRARQETEDWGDFVDRTGQSDR